MTRKNQNMTLISAFGPRIQTDQARRRDEAQPSDIHVNPCSFAVIRVTFWRGVDHSVKWIQP